MQLNKLFTVTLIYLSLLVFSCNSKNNKQIKNYFFISHTRIDRNSYQPYYPVEKINYSAFDQVFLGGDITKATFADEKNLKYLDKIFHLKSNKTHWILGNHEYWHSNKTETLYKKYTGHKYFYTFYKDACTFVILNTQKDYSKISGKQLELLNNIADTIKNSKNLLLFHHKVIWLMDSGFLQKNINISNPPIDTCFDCLNQNNFYSEIYPMLLKIKNKGINVYCIGGDIGFKTSKFFFSNSDGINFIANGIKGFKNVFGTNQVLVIKNNLQTGKLKFEFVKLYKIINFSDWEKEKIENRVLEIKKDTVLLKKLWLSSKKYNNTFEEQIKIFAIKQLLAYFQITQMIIDNPKTLKLLKEKAGKKNLSKDDIFNISKKLLPIITDIYNTKNWIKSIKSKAEKNNILSEEQILQDAIWILYK